MALRSIAVTVLGVHDLATTLSDLSARGIEHGLHLYHPAHPGDSGPALVVFRHSADAFAYLTSTPPSRRIVMASAGARLDDRDICRLLMAGATEVVDLGSTTTEVQARHLSVLLDRWRKVDEIIDSPLVSGPLVGKSASWIASLRSLVEAALSPSRAILIAGETGTGKEAAAHLIHQVGSARHGEFVVVDCGAIVETLAGSELFGHRRGAFTGAEHSREGALGRANGGTLFLDEIGELSLALQAQFLRSLQEGCYKPVGDDRPHASHFRLVSATNRDLHELVAAGRFRADLLFRVTTAVCTLPPLRDRREDIPLLVDAFLGEFLDTSTPPPTDPLVSRCLALYPYPGNVRELRGFVQSMASAYTGEGAICAHHLPRTLLGLLAETGPSCRWNRNPLARDIDRAVSEGAHFGEIRNAVRDDVFQSALRASGGRVPEAADRIRITPRSIQKWIRRQQRPESDPGGPAEPDRRYRKRGR